MPRTARDVVFVDGVRTPFGKAGPNGLYAETRADNMVVSVIRELLRRSPALAPERIGEVAIAATTQTGDQGLTIGRSAAVLAGLPKSVPGYAIDRMCAGAMTAVTTAAGSIALGATDTAIAGGVEHMSHHPMGSGVDPNPRFISERLVDPSALVMGSTAENLHDRFPAVTRDRADAYALASQRKVAQAYTAGHIQPDLVPVAVRSAERGWGLATIDEPPRPDTTLAALAGLKTPFRPHGRVTAGNSAGLNDGATGCVIAAQDVAAELGLDARMRLVDFSFAGVDPEVMGIGPIPATEAVLARNDLTIDDIGLIEINEAFAVQVLAFCDHFKIADDDPRVNPWGGAIALGHPLASSGVRLMIQLARQIALLFARRLEVPVVLTDLDQARLDAGVGHVRAEVAKLRERGRISADVAARLTALVTGSLTKDAFADADFVIEAVFEEIAVKQQVFAEVEAVVRPDCVLATNTSSLSVTEMASRLAHPERVVGFHFFNPVAMMPLVEVVRGARTDDATLATALAVGKALKKNCVLVKDAPAFVVNRLLARFLGEILGCVDEGTPIEVAEHAPDPLGLPMSPFFLLQLVGPAIALHVGETLAAAYPDRFKVSPKLRALVQAGKTAVYRPDLTIDESVAALLAGGTTPQDPPAPPFLLGGPIPPDPPCEGDPSPQTPLGRDAIPPGPLAAGEVRERALEALAEETRLMLDEGVVAAPEDIDLCMILGAGWPFHLGGITPYLDRAGITEKVTGTRFRVSAGRACQRGRWSTTRRTLPTDRSMESGARTLVVTVTPMVLLTRADRVAAAAAEPDSGVPGRRSTWTASSSIRSSRVKCSWKCGDSAGIPMISSSIWVGNRLTPRRMIMSSVRPVIFCIRRMVRAVPGSRRVKSRVRYRMTGVACLVREVKTSSPSSPSGSDAPVSGPITSG